MGASTSNLKRLVKEEYNRKQKDRDYLVLDDILEFELSLSGWRLDTQHMGVVLAIDRDRDGKFQLKELLDFAQYVHDLSADLQLYELQSAVHGTCMLDLWRNINTDAGLSEIVQWLMKVVKQNHAVPAQDYDGATGIESVADTRVTAGMTTDGTALAGAEDEPRCFPQYSDITYVHKNPILGLHRILGNNSGHGQDLNSFVNTLQRVAEERELLDLSSTILDDWVPEGVLSEYVTQVLRNMKLQVSDMDVLQGLLQQRPSRYHYSH